mmetsp:Transcript_12814/g.37675  ORF Transcript_12814/g.37675 Transcript_12814/m.37675 type:complete len:255 (-) Transcript_12814:135-899(-)
MGTPGPARAAHHSGHQVRPVGVQDDGRLLVPPRAPRRGRRVLPDAVGESVVVADRDARPPRRRPSHRVVRPGHRRRAQLRVLEDGPPGEEPPVRAPQATVAGIAHPIAERRSTRGRILRARLDGTQGDHLVVLHPLPPLRCAPPLLGEGLLGGRLRLGAVRREGSSEDRGVRAREQLRLDRDRLGQGDRERQPPDGQHVPRAHAREQEEGEGGKECRFGADGTHLRHTQELGEEVNGMKLAKRACRWLGGRVRF